LRGKNFILHPHFEAKKYSHIIFFDINLSGKDWTKTKHLNWTNVRTYDFAITLFCIITQTKPRQRYE